TNGVAREEYTYDLPVYGEGNVYCKIFDAAGKQIGTYLMRPANPKNPRGAWIINGGPTGAATTIQVKTRDEAVKIAETMIANYRETRTLLTVSTIVAPEKEVNTNVEQPKLPAAEVFTPKNSTGNQAPAGGDKKVGLAPKTCGEVKDPAVLAALG